MDLLHRANQLRSSLPENFRDLLVHDLYQEAEKITQKVVVATRKKHFLWEDLLDRIVTHPIYGVILMAGGLSLAFWITIVGANGISEILAGVLFSIEEWGAKLFEALSIPSWITGIVWHGTYRGLAWVVSVMLPPMAIFFPIFTILEDFGYLPRVAFNLDFLFKKAGAHGKQALTMTMGFGCNAAGVVSTRIIESPRERLIAILTNNFVPCNGRWPTLIMLGTLFVASSFPPVIATLAGVGSILLAVLVGVLFTFLVSYFLSRTILRGEVSAFTLELPPYRKPQILRILYTSLIDRTLLVLWRAVVMAAPAGAVIWLLGNLPSSSSPLSLTLSHFLDPVGRLLGLDGVILLSYIVAIPANEIVIPTMIMIYQKASMMLEVDSLSALKTLFIEEAGWNLKTAICLMLFCVLHNPCSTTILTIWKETGSIRWTLWGALLPLAIAFVVTFLVNLLLTFAGV
jgi:ferrous iron transport protein B